MAPARSWLERLALTPIRRPPGSWILAPGSLLITDSLITDYLMFGANTICDHEITQYVNSVSASPYFSKTYGQNSAAFTSKERQRPSRLRAGCSFAAVGG